MANTVTEQTCKHAFFDETSALHAPVRSDVSFIVGSRDAHGLARTRVTCNIRSRVVRGSPVSHGNVFLGLCCLGMPTLAIDTKYT